MHSVVNLDDGYFTTSFKKIREAKKKLVILFGEYVTNPCFP